MWWNAITCSSMGHGCMNRNVPFSPFSEYAQGVDLQSQVVLFCTASFQTKRMFYETEGRASIQLPSLTSCHTAALLCIAMCLGRKTLVLRTLPAAVATGHLQELKYKDALLRFNSHTLSSSQPIFSVI